MKASVNASDLNQILKTAGKYIDRYGLMAGRLALSVHDGKFEVIVAAFSGRQTTELRQWVDAGDVYNDDFERVPAEDGFCVVCPKDLAPIKNAAKGSEILIESQKDTVSITTDGFAFEVKTACDPTGFPPSLEPGDKSELAETLEIVSDDCGCFGYICLALSQDDTRPEFTGAVLRDGALAATDGRRLHYCPLSALFGTGTLTGIIAPELLRFIADGHSGTLREYRETRQRKEKEKGKTIIVTETVASWHILEAPGFIFKSKPIFGQFPDFFKVIPNYREDEVAEIGAEALATVVKPLYAGWKINLTVALRDCPDGVKLQCFGKPGPKSSDQPPRTAVLKDIKLPRLPVRLDPSFIMDALTGVSGAIKFCCIDADSPVWLGQYDGYRFGRGAVIMPKQL